MAEENHGSMPDFSDADAIPPIDNIHAPKPEPDLLPPSNDGQLPQPLYSGYPMDTDMPEAAVRFSMSLCFQEGTRGLTLPISQACIHSSTANNTFCYCTNPANRNSNTTRQRHS